MGRPKLFDRDAVLECALGVFWEHGYHDASVRRLAEAMGINVATVFSEFGDKEGLYEQALLRYEMQKVPLFIGVLERPGANIDTVVQVIRDFARFAESGTAPGCLITNSAIEHAPDPMRSQQALSNYLERLQSAYASALRATEGLDMTEGLRDRAQVLAATTLGLFVMIRGRIAAETVHHVAEGIVASLLADIPDAVRAELKTAPPTTERSTSLPTR